jgi:hypothetical protein
MIVRIIGFRLSVRPFDLESQMLLGHVVASPVKEHGDGPRLA